MSVKHFVVAALIGGFATPACAFPTGIAHVSGAMACPSEQAAIQYLESRVAPQHCDRIASGATVAIVYVYGETHHGRRLAQVKAVGDVDAKIVYAPIDQFDLGSEIAQK